MTANRRRIFVFAAALIALAGLAAACGDRTTTNVENPDPGDFGVTVSGEGTVTAPPDVAMITLGVSTQAATVADARDQAASALDAMIASIRNNGVDEDDIQTQNLSIFPEYSYPDGNPVLRGYRVTNQVHVTVRDIDTTSQVVDDAVAAGGDATQIQGISFTIDDPASLRDQARELAVRDARARADVLASAAGVSLGDAIRISETTSPDGPIPVFARDEAAQSGADIATPIEPGQLDVTVLVTVTWAIE
jgi:uncharacterized protein YggE